MYMVKTMSKRFEAEIRSILYFIVGQIFFLREYEISGLILTVLGSLGLLVSVFQKD